MNQRGDFLKIKNYLRQNDPKISCRILESRHERVLGKLLSLARPTLAVSMVPVARFKPLRGRFCQGRKLSKSQEYSLLDAAGFPVPKWQLLLPDAEPNLAGYGDYVVTKPDHGMRGALVKIKKKNRVRYKAHSKMSDEHRGRSAPLVESDARILAQQFIYTGEWPISYRVTTLFGKVIHSFKVEANHDRVPLPGPDAFGKLGNNHASIVASGRGCAMSLSCDEEVIRLGEAASAAFPDVPLLGFDIVREIPSGKLFIVEANAIGYVWHFSSNMGLNFQRENNFNLESQFDGLRKAALILGEKTQELAR